MNIRSMKCTIGTLVRSGKLNVASDTDQNMLNRIENIDFSFDDLLLMSDYVNLIGVTEEFKKVINLFKVPAGIIPAGFRPELVYDSDDCMRVDLKRDITYLENGQRRPSNILFSANTANPYDVKTMKSLLASLTTNPQLIYQRFINDPKANIGNEFKDRYEVLQELCNIVGTGVDISIEVNNPFAEKSIIMEEIARFEEILTPYRLVVKVPHTGPLNADNYKDFLAGNLNVAYDNGKAKDYFMGHNMAYSLAEKGYRVNFTLMFDPHQTALALLAKPYFINAFIERRYLQSIEMERLLDNLDNTNEESYREQLCNYMIHNDIIQGGSIGKDAEKKARELVAYRELDNSEGCDGLDSVRHCLRLLRQSDLPESKLIICNMSIAKIYKDIDKLLVQKEFEDMKKRVIITCEPDYFGQFTSAPGIYNYQRAFLENVDKS